MTLSMFWRCESETLDGTDDFSAGDQSATPAFGGALGPAAGMVGTNGIIVASGGAQYRLDSTTAVLDRLVGSVGFLFRATTWAGGTVVWVAYGSSSGYQYGIQLTGADELRFYAGDIDGSPVSAITTTANLTTGTVYGVVGRWDHANNLLRIEVYSDPLGTPTLIQGVSNTSGYTAPVDLVQENGLRIGDMSDVGFRGHFDNLFLSQTYNEPIQQHFGITSFTQYGAAALAGTAADVAGASAALSTQVRLGAAAAGVASSAGALLTAIRLAASAISRATAAGTLNTGALMQASASDVVMAVAALTTAVRFSAAAADTASASGALTNWATVTLAGDLYQGPGGVLDPNFWIDSVPTLGTTLYYDPVHIAIAPNGEISSDSNDCAALVQFYDGTSWALGLIVITPHLVAYSRDIAAASGQLSTAIELAAAATALATAAAALGTGAGLSADASDVASATGSLITGIPLSALAENVATAVAGLTNEIRLQADAVDEAAATANLNGVISLNAAATAISSVIGNLSTQVRLGGVALGDATVSADLATGIRLGGTALNVASAAAALLTSIRLGGSANNIATASADLTTRNPLLAAAISVATAVATISTGISLSANAQSIAQASGVLGSSIDLLAEARSEAQASAVLTDVIETPPIGVYASDPRFYVAKSRWSFFGSNRTPRFELKDPVEKVVLTFDFSSVLAADETLDGPITLTIIATSGTDGDAQALFNGYPAYDMTKRKILQPVQAGVAGCDYYVKMSAATSNQQKTLALAGLLPIRG